MSLAALAASTTPTQPVTFKLRFTLVFVLHVSEFGPGLPKTRDCALPVLVPVTHAAECLAPQSTMVLPNTSMSLAALAASTTPTQPVTFKLKAISAHTLEARISFNEVEPPKERPRLKLAARTKPVTENAWAEKDSGAGQNQWGALNVVADRKKQRCAECTRPIPEGGKSLLCDRCMVAPVPAPAAPRKSTKSEANASANEAKETREKLSTSADPPSTQSTSSSASNTGLSGMTTLCVGVVCIVGAAALLWRLRPRLSRVKR